MASDHSVETRLCMVIYPSPSPKTEVHVHARYGTGSEPTDHAETDYGALLAKTGLLYTSAWPKRDLALLAWARDELLDTTTRVHAHVAAGLQERAILAARR